MSRRRPLIAVETRARPHPLPQRALVIEATASPLSAMLQMSTMRDRDRPRWLNIHDILPPARVLTRLPAMPELSLDLLTGAVKHWIEPAHPFPDRSPIMGWWKDSLEGRFTQPSPDFGRHADYYEDMVEISPSGERRLVPVRRGSR